MPTCQHRLVTLLTIAVISIGLGCGQKSPNPQPVVGPGGGGGGGGPMKQFGTTVSVPIGKDSACYADVAWVALGQGAGTNTVKWHSNGEEYTVLFNPAATPLVNGSTIDVPAGGDSAVYTLSIDAYTACSQNSNVFACYYPYLIAVTKPQSITDTCGPSPLTVGIHIKP